MIFGSSGSELKKCQNHLCATEHNVLKKCTSKLTFSLNFAIWYVLKNSTIIILYCLALLLKWMNKGDKSQRPPWSMNRKKHVLKVPRIFQFYHRDLLSNSIWINIENGNPWEKCKYWSELPLVYPSSLRECLSWPHH